MQQHCYLHEQKSFAQILVKYYYLLSFWAQKANFALIDLRQLRMHLILTFCS